MWPPWVGDSSLMGQIMVIVYRPPGLLVLTGASVPLQYRTLEIYYHCEFISVYQNGQLKHKSKIFTGTGDTINFAGDN